MIREELLELAIKTIPYPDQIKDISLEENHVAIRFTWRGNSFRVCHISKYAVMVEEVGDGVLISSDMSILLKELLDIRLIKEEVEKHD